MAKAAELVPKNAWAVRLELIRDRAALKTFTAFVERVCRTPGEFSMHTARTWHTSRQPSPDYLSAVVSEFGVSAHWLLTGDGEPFEPREIVSTKHKAETEPLWIKLAKVVADRGHYWAFEKYAPVTPHVYEFCARYLKSRDKRLSLERLIEVMDEHFFMLREGFPPPVHEWEKTISALHSALAAAWLQTKED